LGGPGGFGGRPLSVGPPLPGPGGGFVIGGLR
jgi:hypothetical protein